MALTGTVHSIYTSKQLSVTISGTDTTTVGGNAVIRLVASTDMFVNFGTTSTSDGTNFFLTGGLPEYVKSTAANISAKVASGTGTLYISEML